jgi:hypothetical protein
MPVASHLTTAQCLVPAACINIIIIIIIIKSTQGRVAI